MQKNSRSYGIVKDTGCDKGYVLKYSGQFCTSIKGRMTSVRLKMSFEKIKCKVSTHLKQHNRVKFQWFVLIKGGSSNGLNLLYPLQNFLKIFCFKWISQLI